MPIAVKPLGIAQPPAYRRVGPGDPLLPGETFTISDDTDITDTVLDADGASIRKMRQADHDNMKDRERGRAVDNGNPLVALLIEDLAALRNQTVQAYKAELKNRLI